MSNRRHQLSSIPEKNETEEDVPQGKKYVSKNKHDVLKAKYKCLKKLFQVYDATVIGILPTDEDNHYEQGDHYSIPEEPRKHSRRRKSYRSKIDASASTNDQSSGDITLDEKGSSIASSAEATIKRSCSTQMIELTQNKSESEMKSTVHPSNTVIDDDIINCNYSNSQIMQQLMQDSTLPHQMQSMAMPHLKRDAPRKLTRFQSFIQRLFGIRREKAYNPITGHLYAASDNYINHQYGEKRRRTGLRFRRLRKAKKVHSEIQLRDLSCPAIMQYIQSIQKHCLLDRTPRQCPFTGCNSLFFGIINYNDHLNLSHFGDKRYICHYCHEGFPVEYDKYVHENEHLGISKLKNSLPNPSAFTIKSHLKKTSITQTDPNMSNCTVPEEKLKKIVSFFDRLADTEHMLAEMKSNRFSETNLQTSKAETNSVSASETTTDKRTVSCVNFLNRKIKSQDLTESIVSEVGSKDPRSETVTKCLFCREEFNNRHRLNQHIEFEHGVRDKFRKLHSCAGFNTAGCQRVYAPNNNMVKLKTGQINIRSNDKIEQNASVTSPDTVSEVTRDKSDTSLSYEPSTNIIYSDSIDSMKNQSMPSNQRSRVITNYRWEPGTKIIRI